jgi:serine/threonine protein kinase
MSANENHTPNALPAGYRFNEFEIKEVIGGGGFGIVYRAWDHQLERTIAIKEYMPVSLAVRAADMSLELRGERFHKLFTAGRNSFIQEARLLARFNHPGLLHVQITSPDSIDENWIRRLLPPLFGAIDTIHAAGYLHRDISLDNIQIQENQLPVLLDFGSARKEIGNLSDETEIMLKPGFAPIEQYSEEGEIEQGPWTDIYALGAVLHNLITGHAPPVSVVRCIEDNYQPLVERKPEGYSLPLLHAIDCALAMKPADRPQSIDAFASLIDLPVSDVEALSTTIPLVAEPVVPVEPSVATPEPQVLAVNHAAAAVEPLTPRNVRRLSPGLVVAAAIAVLAVVVVVWKANQHSEAPPVAASTAPAAPAAAAGNSVASSAPTVATVYLRLQAGENVMLNGEARDVKPSSSGFASLNLAAGNYRIEVRNGNQVHSQSLTIDKPGTWLINPAQ